MGSYIISIAKTASKKIGATFDVISLYTSIPWEFGLEAIDYFLTIYQEDLHSRFREEFILESVNFILKNNRLTFDSKFYLQIKGIAMGKIFTSFYANLIMGYEIKVYSIICQSYALASKHFENSWYRYLGNCQVLLKDNLIKAEHLLSILNQINNNIQFTIERDQTRLPFLDIVITL